MTNGSAVCTLEIGGNPVLKGAILVKDRSTIEWIYIYDIEENIHRLPWDSFLIAINF